MSLELFSPEGLVAQFVCTTKGSGHFLSPIDYGVIQRWLTAANGKPEPVLLILEEHLPKHFQNSKNLPLTILESRVTKLIRNFRSDAPEISN